MNDSTQRVRKPRRTAAAIILSLAVLLLALAYGTPRAAKLGMRGALKAFQEEFPAEEILDTKYEGNPLSPSKVTVYALEAECGFPFISNYRRDNGKWLRSTTEYGCYERRVKAKQSNDSLSAHVSDFLSGKFTVRYALEGEEGFAVFTEETDRETLTALWNGLRDISRKEGNTMPFSIISAEPDLLERILSRDQRDIIRESGFFRYDFEENLATELPAFWGGSCASMFYDYVTDPNEGFDHMDEACASNSMDRYVRQIHCSQYRPEYIMSVFRVW